MLRTRLVSTIIIILAIFAFAIVFAGDDDDDDDDDDAMAPPPCPCFDKAFLDDVHLATPLSCSVNDQGDRLDRPELAIISLRGNGLPNITISPERFSWQCTIRFAMSLPQVIPITEAERISCAELLLAFIADNSLACP